LHEFVATQVFAALGAANLAYLQLHSRATPSLAATEQCPWRGRVLAGETHDENTWAAGGCLGQSGVFGDAEAVCRVMAEFQAAWDGRSALLAPDTLRRFLRRPAGLPNATFRLGFDSPSESGSAAGHGFGPYSFGHLGFTGASVWCDPYSALTVALLTNRVHPTRANEAIKDLRPRVHDAVIEELAR
jgi:CubicO group peptidase (beta-lactamase class C family)